ncbi:MAG: DUF364 domain-containing protein [Dehalococcoidales bacterium]|nr:DUF364 domain-containing protein [Dehalococcoidales bacterium]
MKLLDDLIATLKGNSMIREVYSCAFWTAVVSKNCGLSSTFRGDHPHHGMVREAGALRGKPALEIARYAQSDNLLEASIGMAAVNSLIDVDEARCVTENALDMLMARGQGKNIAVVGHFPWVPKLKDVARELWVLEQRPRDDDFPAAAADKFLPQADVVAITGTSFINHTLERLLALSQDSFIILVGPTSPLSPLLFDWGVDVISGAIVDEPESVIRSISEGAIFRQVRGVRLVNMVKERQR